ncbi:polysaccharide biosynthesis protein [Cellvibrio mixtus]|jgi:protein-tyrosine kinase|uniref:Polysaccharide biosynthesis protein n=1 Tax=Cellvibrio mixtus TaxID=39650 RepID=A0A266QCT6_9GAMM|nr:MULTISPECIES: CpsD/CapB family tyrosine-protein kinase [Cellvibrio]AQT61409.1 polysaccharide biosynthesis protein [Cellvibrio sp. PSBB023]OZY87693.1 polysaccharide biosynthesis protein [Cellvibrio mixtus]
MEQAKERSLKQLMAGVDALVETSDQLVKTAVLEHRKREKIKNMELPCLWTQDELYEKKVIFTGMRQRELLNAFREVRIRLLERSKSDNMVVLVSSVSKHGGSSFVGFNLAATFALDQHKTALYVDCNPYSSTAEKYTTQDVDEGLTQYLTDYTVPLKNIIYPSGIERLRVIPSGGSSESAAEFFNSKRMEVFVAEIKSRYPDRFIVLDAPSVQQSTEARILAKYCDHALLVVPYGSAVTDEVLAAVDAVGKDRFAGLVFNN